MKGHERFLTEGEGSRENLIFSFEKNKGKNGSLQTRHVGRDSLTHTLKHIELKIYVHSSCNLLLVLFLELLFDYVHSHFTVSENQTHFAF